MEVNLSLNVSLGWVTLFAFAIGVLIVKWFWRQDSRKKMARIERFRLAVRDVLFDGRKNALIENIVARAESGNDSAIKDWELLDKLFKAALEGSGRPFRVLREQYWDRVIKGTREPSEVEK